MSISHYIEGCKNGPKSAIFGCAFIVAHCNVVRASSDTENEAMKIYLKSYLFITCANTIQKRHFCIGETCMDVSVCNRTPFLSRHERRCHGFTMLET